MPDAVERSGRTACGMAGGQRVAREGAEPPDSLCWSCLRATWDCLCPWPQALPPGARAVEVQDGGEVVRVVVRCPLYWAE